MTKPLPKSLHTVTVLVAIARAHDARMGAPYNGLDYALDILGYSGCRDEYSLRAQAAAKLSKGNV